MSKEEVAKALREKFFLVAERVESLSGIIDPNVPSSLTYAKSILDSIVDDLSKMGQIGKNIDEENSDGQQSGLVQEIFGLLGQSKTLLSHIEKAITIQKTLGGGVEEQGAGSQQQEDEEEEKEEDGGIDVARVVSMNEDAPLTREEIGQLLILVSRALSLNIISQAQRGFLKNQIIGQHGMLRVILQFPTVDQIMGALKTISSSVDK